RLRFDTEMQGVAGALAQFGDVIDAAPKVFCDRIDLAAVAPETFVRTGQRAHTSFHPVGQKRGEDVEEAVCEIESGRRTPIGRENLLFYPATVKPAKREAVDRENVTVFGREPVAKMAQGVGIDQLAGSFVAQA